MTRRGRLGAVLAAVVLAACALAGCGGSSGGGGATGSVSISPATTLNLALTAVSADGPAAKYFEWGDTAALRALAGQSIAPAINSPPDPAAERWQGVLALGADQFGNSVPQVAADLGVNLHDATSAITIGVAPETATQIIGPGVAQAKISAALTKAGATNQGGVMTLSLTDVLSLAGKAGLNPGSLEAVSLGKQTFVAGSDTLSVQAAQAGQPLLSSLSTYRAAAGCLGDVLWAVIAPASSAGLTGGGLIALGGVRPASASAPIASRVCVVGPGAAAQAARMRRTFVPATVLLKQNAPLKTYVTASTVGQGRAAGQSWASATVTLQNAASPEFLLQLYQDDAIAQLLSTTCTPAVTALGAGSNPTPGELKSVCAKLGLK